MGGDGEDTRPNLEEYTYDIGLSATKIGQEVSNNLLLVPQQ